jgi:hypothetical protein
LSATTGAGSNSKQQQLPLAPVLNKLGNVTEALLVEILKDSGAASLFQGGDGDLNGGRGEENGQAMANDAYSSSTPHTTRSIPILVNALVDEWPFLQRLRTRIQRDFLNVDMGAVEGPREAAQHFLHADERCIPFKVDFRFHNLRAQAPSWHSTLRPLVAYINEQRPFIPVSCHFNLPRDQFIGAWTLHEAGVIRALEDSTSRAFDVLLADRHRQLRRLKKVSLWSLYSLVRNLRTWFLEAGYLVYPRIALAPSSQ